MPLRPSETTWDNLDALLNAEKKNTTYINRTILGLSFFVLVVLGIILCT